MQRLLSLLALGNCARAANFDPVRVMMERRATSTAPEGYYYKTLGYTSAGMEGESTIWAPSSLFYTDMYTTSSGSYYATCTYDYAYVPLGTRSYTYEPVRNSCPIYTACSLGIMLASADTYQCAGDGYMCGTVLVYQSWGASDPTTGLACTSIRSDSAFEAISIFVDRPNPIESPLTTQAPSTASTLSPAPALTTSMASETATVNKNTGGGGSNNAGVIAGATIGGLAVVGLIGVAVLYILKRSKREPRHQVAAADDYPIYQPEKQLGVQQHYDPHKSTLYSQTSGSPHTYSATTSFPEGHGGGDHSGLLSPSPQQPQPQSGSPTVGAPPPNAHP